MHPFRVAVDHPDRAAIVMAATGATVTFAELADRIRRVQHVLHEHGLRPGDSMAIFSENTIDFLPTVWAAQSSGLYYTAINSHLTAPEVAHIVNDCGAQMLVTTELLADVAVALTPEVTPGVRSRLMAGRARPGWESFDAAISSQPATDVDGSCEGDFFLYSSGTTGRPKGIRRPLTLAPLGYGMDHVVSFLTMIGISPGDVYLSPAPLYHAAPLACSMGVHRIGATSVIMEKFDPEQALALIERHRVGCTQMVPTMFVRMLKLRDDVRSSYDLSSLHKVVHAAAPCPVDVKRAMIEWLGPILDEYYAATEGMGTTYITSEDWLAHPGSVGRPLIGVPHILDDDGVEQPTRSDGTIWFEGTAPFTYHGDDVETAKTRNERGWTTVGDVGHLDDDGYLYLSDRKAFMIISGGANIYPQEIENALVTHPKVLDVAVFGVPNPDFGEEVKAVVQPVDWSDAGPDLADELIAYCRQRVAGYKCPRSVEFMEQLPRLDSGKLYKRPLRDRYWNVASA
jgi:long-chain acyl-CoA synthetase